ncbi:DNA processing protein DprA [Cohnella xylanilytica]|uniref:DNA-protecting protein DprA n=1 Tax=Cohnella xylanilytica TaxID=557555 RepID=A0A841U598_9BACL|nr:DNA-processing protein DprA [Cohnella xylanilytica]MBB6694762.1 DNA-protecting protein DprA [Cohnella xylanilytica]GIO10845.1 DNA processing protein DprA [Cohnella xylanilytica]
MTEELSMSEAIVAMHETEGIGWITIDRIVRRGGVQGAQRRREADWREYGLYPRQSSKLVEKLRPEAVDASRRRRARKGVSVVTPLDPGYPRLLLEIEQPPWALYYIGRLELADQPSVAIVGTRMATAYGRRVAEDLAAECASGGLTVVSGLAKGIDAAAHAGALHKPAGTVAVLASPADSPYPYENRALYRDIAREGLVLSETPLGTPLHPGQFPLRNRIIAGLSLGTVVVEAAERSGAIITAEHALKMNRDVFVVPGPITSPRSAGALRLFREGAKPVMDVSDIKKEYPYLFPRVSEPPSAGFGQAAAKRLEMSPAERTVYELLLDRPRTVDELAEERALEDGALHAALLALQMKRIVVQRPGALYALL